MIETTSPVVLHSKSIGHGPDLVILHGLFGSGENWRNQAKRLADNYTVHSLDARNHGSSPHTDTISYPEMAADVALTCEQLNIKTMSLLGHSMGGKTAMQLALIQPHLIDRLLIVDIGPQKYPNHHQPILQGLALLHAKPSASRQVADNRLSEFVDNEAVRAFLLKNLHRTVDNDYRLKINLNTISNQYENIAAAINPTVGNSSFNKPTLFIKGANSDYLQTGDRELVLSLFPKAKVKSIAGAGHWPHSEKPDVVYKVISDFLADNTN